MSVGGILLKLFQNEQRLRVIEKIKSIDNNPVTVTKNYSIMISKIKENVMKLMIRYPEKKYCINDMETEIINNFNKDNNIFLLKLDKRNKIEEIINKGKIRENLDNKAFDYLCRFSQNPEKILELINEHKMMLLDSDTKAEDKINTESITSFIFLDINNKIYYDTKITYVNHFIGKIVPYINVPVKLKFRVKEFLGGMVKLEFNSEYNEEILGYTNFILYIKEILGYPINEKYEFDLSVSGEYLINISDSDIVELNVKKNINLNGNRYQEILKARNEDYRFL